MELESSVAIGEEVELLNINVKDIEFGDRARKQYAGLQALVDDFKKQYLAGIENLIENTQLNKDRITKKKRIYYDLMRV